MNDEPTIITDISIKPKRREVDRHFKWKHGHDPNDDDATEASPWKYINLEAYDPSDPDQRALLTGGPESGMPCVCGEMTRIAGGVSAKEIMEQENVGIANKDTMTEADWERLEGQKIMALACPKCGRITQMDKEFVPYFRGWRPNA